MINKFIVAAFAFTAVTASANVAEARDYPVQLTYVAPAEVQRGEPTIVFGDVTNERERGENWLAAIRGGYGNPLKVLVTEQPVHEVVAQGFRDGLAARGMATERGPHVLNLRVIRFDGNQFIPKDAHIIVETTLIDVASGATLYQHTYQVDRAGPGIGGGIFTPVEPLRALANDAMNAAIDQALDDPAFRAALPTSVSAPAAAPEAATEASPTPTPATTP